MTLRSRSSGRTGLSSCSCRPWAGPVRRLALESGVAVPAAPMSTDSPSPPLRGPALPALLAVLDALMSSLAEDAANVLQPHVVQCLSETRDARWLVDVFQHFGWDGACFTRPVDARSLSCRLRTFLFDGLQKKGRGAFAVVYKVGTVLKGLGMCLIDSGHRTCL